MEKVIGEIKGIEVSINLAGKLEVVLIKRIEKLKEPLNFIAMDPKTAARLSEFLACAAKSLRDITPDGKWKM